MANQILHYNIGKNLKLPYEVIRGSQKERFKKAYEMNKKIFNEISQKMVNDTISISDFSKTIDDALSPYKIKHCVKKKEKGENFSEAYIERIVETSIVNKNEKNIKLKRFLFGFDIQKQKITTNKYAIFHEVGHFLDSLFAPKMTIRELKYMGYPDETYSSMSEIVDTAMNYALYSGIPALTNLVEDFTKIKSLLNKLPDEVAIDTLQVARSYIKTEMNQYQNSLKMQIRKPSGNWDDIVSHFLFVANAHFHTRHNLLSKLLESRIAKVRAEHKANLLKNI